MRLMRITQMWRIELMEEYKGLSTEMKKLLEKSESLGWWWKSYIEESQNNRTYVEIGKHSPAGEDFSMIIDFKTEDQCSSFMEDLKSYCEDFDIDEHIEMWIESRGNGVSGVPSTRRLVEYAEEILEMIKGLHENLERVLHLELSDEQAARCDEIYNAVYEMCKVVADDEYLEWDMHYLGEITELVANMMVNRGYKVRFPAIITKEDGTQHIEEYYEPEKEGGDSDNE